MILGRMVFVATTLALGMFIFWRMTSVLAKIPEPDRNPFQSPGSLFASRQPIASTTQTNLHYFPLIFGRPKPLGSLADGWYLMIDDGHIVHREMPRYYHPFQKYEHNPILVADKPWEGKAIQLYGSVLPGYRMWYSSYDKAEGVSQVLYAESQDGLHWFKPVINGLGSNALFEGQNAGLVSVMHTPLEGSGPYKLMVHQDHGFYGYWSISGIDTYPYLENPLFYNGGDVAQFYWDPNTQRYGGTAKETVPVAGVPRRSIRLLFSDNFIQWSEHPSIYSPDAIDDQNNPGLYPHFYGLPVFPMGEQYVGLLWILKAHDRSGLLGKISVQLVSSHDGVSWIREEGNRPPILDVGPPGSWDDGQIYTSIQPLRVGNELWLYYSGCNREHGEDLYATKCAIGVAKVPYHRLASLQGSGVVLTENLTAEGDSLHLNYDASQGTIRVEVLKDGVTVPGFEAESCTPLSGDSLDQIVTWAGQTGLPDSPFQIKFHLENSSIFAFSIQSP